MAVHFFMDPAFRNFGIVVVQPTTRTILDALCYCIEPEYAVLKKQRGVTEADIWHMGKLVEVLDALQRRFHATDMHIETPAGAQSARAMKTLGMVVGALVAWSRAHQIHLHLYSRAEAKKAVVGVSGLKQKGRFQKSLLKKLAQARVTEKWALLDRVVKTRTKNESEHICDAAALIFAAEKRGLLR